MTVIPGTLAQPWRGQLYLQAPRCHLDRGRADAGHTGHVNERSMTSLPVSAFFLHIQKLPGTFCDNRELPRQQWPRPLLPKDVCSWEHER